MNSIMRAASPSRLQRPAISGAVGGARTPRVREHGVPFPRRPHRSDGARRVAVFLPALGQPWWWEHRRRRVLGARGRASAPDGYTRGMFSTAWLTSQTLWLPDHRALRCDFRSSTSPDALAVKFDRREDRGELVFVFPENPGNSASHDPRRLGQIFAEPSQAGTEAVYVRQGDSDCVRRWRASYRAHVAVPGVVNGPPERIECASLTLLPTAAPSSTRLRRSGARRRLVTGRSHLFVPKGTAWNRRRGWPAPGKGD